MVRNYTFGMVVAALRQNKEFVDDHSVYRREVRSTQGGHVYVGRFLVHGQEHAVFLTTRGPYFSINRMYVDENAEVHLSSCSVGGVYVGFNPDDLTQGFQSIGEMLEVAHIPD